MGREVQLFSETVKMLTKMQVKSKECIQNGIFAHVSKHV